MATITLSSVKKSFGDIDVIHGVDADIADGELIVIVGPSGCGKSTLLRMVAGLETVTAGEIRIGGEVVNDREPMDRNIAMVFQNYALYPHMSVFDNMAYGLKIAKTPKDEILRRVEDAAKLLQLDGLLDRKPRQLSGGQRQRVAMGRAIVRKPQAFLFDEPLSNLDAKLRVQMRLEIKGLQSDLGVTSLYVTHDQVEAMTLAHRMIVMNEGRVEQIGAPLDVYMRPATLFAAQFIGSPSMNVLPATVDAGRLTLENGVGFSVPTAISGKATFGIRPEHLALDEAGPIAVQIGMTEPLGANTLAHGHLEGTRTPITASIPGALTLADATEIMRFSPEGENVHLFDAHTNDRIA